MLFAGILFIFYVNNNLVDFINLCILQVGEFLQNKTLAVISLGKNIILMILSILIAVILRRNKIEKNKNTIMLIFFALGANLVIIPIVNDYHVIIANILWIVIILYEIYQILEPSLKIKQVYNIIRIISIITVVTIGAISITKIFMFQGQTRIIEKSNVFFGAIIERNQKDEIDIITKYIESKKNEGKDIKIISTNAMLYSLNLKLNNWYFDLPLIGNMGKDGQTKAIEKIHTLKNTIILIEVENENYKSHYQFMDNIRQHVENNYQKIGEFHNYNVYEID